MVTITGSRPELSRTHEVDFGLASAFRGPNVGVMGRVLEVIEDGIVVWCSVDEDGAGTRLLLSSELPSASSLQRTVRSSPATRTASRSRRSRANPAERTMVEHALGYIGNGARPFHDVIIDTIAPAQTLDEVEHALVTSVFAAGASRPSSREHVEGVRDVQGRQAAVAGRRGRRERERFNPARARAHDHVDAHVSAHADVAMGSVSRREVRRWSRARLLRA